MSEHQKLFLEEASELFSDAYDLLLSAEEQDSLNSGEIDELFRIIHTIKGSSGGTGFIYLSGYTHLLENLLEDLREGDIEYKSGLVSFLIDSLDKMQSILGDESKGELNSSDYEQSLEMLKQKVSEFGKVDEVSKVEDTGFVLFSDEDLKGSQDDDGFMLFSAEDFENLASLEEEKQSDLAPISVANETKSQPQKSGSEPKDRTSGSIRVDLAKIDTLLNRVGELVITNSMLGKFSSMLPRRVEQDEMNERLAQLERHIRDLQDAVMSVRMIPMEQVYAKLPKLVRDLSRKLDKRVRLNTTGGSVEIDKMMIEGLNDPLMHILRNALDHGLEKPEIREIQGKDPVGTVTISAMQENGQMVITVSDDGAGIDIDRVTQKAIERQLITREVANRLSDDEKVDLIFSAGVSTAKEVSDVSGRGVGMDVVRINISKLGGIVRARSTRGKGSRFTIILPLTLAILDGLNISVGSHRYILPLSAVVESLQPVAAQVKQNGDGTKRVLMLRDNFIPIIELYQLFNIEPKFREIHEGMLIILRAADERFALFVDEFGSQQQVVVKSLERNFKRVGGIGGATVQGDGTISLILDPLGIIESDREKRGA